MALEYSALSKWNNLQRVLKRHNLIPFNQFKSHLIDMKKCECGCFNQFESLSLSFNRQRVIGVFIWNCFDSIPYSHASLLYCVKYAVIFALFCRSCYLDIIKKASLLSRCPCFNKYSRLWENIRILFTCLYFHAQATLLHLKVW